MFTTTTPRIILECQTLAFSRDSKLLAVAGAKGHLQIYNLQTRAHVAAHIKNRSETEFRRIYFLCNDTVLFFTTARGFVTVDPAKGAIIVDRADFLQKFDSALSKTVIQKTHRIDDVSVFVGTNRGCYIVSLTPHAACTPCKSFVAAVPALDGDRLKARTFRLDDDSKARLPDDLRLVHQLAADSYLCTYDSNRLGIVAEKAGTLRTLGKTGKEFGHICNCILSCSDSGGLVLVSMPSGEKAESRHWLIETDTNTLHRIQLTQDHRFASAISPDGRYLAFITVTSLRTRYSAHDDDDVAYNCSVELVSVRKAPTDHNK